MKGLPNHQVLTGQTDSPLPGATRRFAPSLPLSTRLRSLKLASLALLLIALLAACGSGSTTSANQAKLDRDLQAARAQGIPERFLAPIVAQEQQIAHSGGFLADLTGSADAARARSYQLLDAQLHGVIAQAGPQLKAGAAQALRQFSSAIQRLARDGFVAANVYQHQLEQAQILYQHATIPGDYVHVQQIANNGVAAIAALRPAYAALQSLRQQQTLFAAAGIDTTLLQQQYTTDLQQFRAATTAAAYRQLTAHIAAQQHAAAQAATQQIPRLGKARLHTLSQLIAEAQSAGINTSTYTSTLNTARRTLAKTTTLSAYLALAQQLNQQMSNLQGALAQKQAQAALNTLQSLINYGNQHNWLVYEYASDLSDLQSDLANAATTADYQAVIDKANIQITNLRAMLANYQDTTPADRPHVTDLQLMQTYGLHGKVIVVSLGEQVARMYDNGRLVYWSYITTGRRLFPTPAGLWHVFQKLSPTVFVSGDPPGSPFYYAPTYIHWALAFHVGGYFLHDAWWRLKFGPGSNLPHYDPSAWNDGSHGCINFPMTQAQWLYNWAPLGTPVIVY
jgi:lipoprotein-anchoring transpeptidase ErfK/SrfK